MHAAGSHAIPMPALMFLSLHFSVESKLLMFEFASGLAWLFMALCNEFW